MKRLKIISWALFDFAETVFSANIISVFFPLWIVNTLGGTSYHYSFVYSFSLLISIIVGILTGKIADQTGTKSLFFKTFVIAVIFLLFSLYFVDSLWMALFLFFLMNIFYQQSLIFYNSLLFDISTDENRGLISGIGISVGYVGGIVGLLITNYLSNSPPGTFFITALIFTIFAFPSLIFLEAKSSQQKKIKIKINKIITDKKFLIFLISILFLTDAAHGLIVFMSLYLNKVFHFSQDQIVNTIVFAGIFAVISAPFAGLILKHLNASKFMFFVFASWIIGFIVLYFSNKFTIYLIAIFFGIMLSSLWVVLRILVIDISPSYQLTTRFALMAFSERMASIISPLTWGIVVYILGEDIFAYKLAALILGVYPLIGLLIYIKFYRLLD